MQVALVVGRAGETPPTRERQAWEGREQLSPRKYKYNHAVVVSAAAVVVLVLVLVVRGGGACFIFGLDVGERGNGGRSGNNSRGRGKQKEVVRNDDLGDGSQAPSGPSVRHVWACRCGLLIERGALHRHHHHPRRTREPQTLAGQAFFFLLFWSCRRSCPLDERRQT